MKVKCIVSRRIADDDYQLGQEYNVTKERINKYPNSFHVIPDPQSQTEKPNQEKKQSTKKTATKRVGKTEDKSG
jgi:hypothetical protein